MKIFSGFEQYSMEWESVRAGLITASEVDALISPKWEVRKGKGVETYVAQKAAERWVQGPLPGYMQTMDMDLGSIMENECLPWLSWEFGWKLDRIPFISTDDGVCGCSPDAICNDFGVEIKCPGALNHVKYVLANEVPDDYKAQVQFSLWVTGMKEWKFVSYRRGFPNLVLSVKPDTEAQKSISIAVAAFKTRMDAAFDRLVALNEGKPPQKNTFRESLLTQQEPEPLDVPL